MNTQKTTGYPSIDKPWMKYYTQSDKQTKAPTCTLYQNIYNNNSKYLKDIAILYYGNKITYAQLFNNVDACAKSLVKYGVREGDCITLCTAAVPEAIYLMIACSKIGAIANFVNPLFTTEQMVQRINDTKSKLLFVMDEMISYIVDAVPHACIEKTVIMPVTESMSKLAKLVVCAEQKNRNKKRTDDKRFYSWKSFTKYGNDYNGETERSYEKNRGCIMVYSSGTTGASKGILLTNDGINATIAHYDSEDFNYERGDTFYAVIPIWFSTGNVLDILMPLRMGMTVIPELQFEKERIIDGIKKYKPTMTLNPTSIWMALAQSKKWKKIDLKAMKYPITEGEAVTPQEEKIITDFLQKSGCNAPLIKGYGMCELGSTVTSTSPEHNKVQSSGYPIKGVTVAVFDTETNEELPYGQRGEIRVNSPARMKEYYKNPVETKKYFYEDQNHCIWGCTGDIGYVDEDGYLFVEGRANDSFYSEDGKRIYLFDIERIVLEDEMVAQCKAVAVQINGKFKPILHVVLQKNGVTDAKTVIPRIYKKLSEQLPQNAVPVAYKLRQTLPVHPNGKRNVEALKAENDGFVDLMGNGWRVR